MGLFGRSFSIAPPGHALRGLPCLGSFSVVQQVRHIEGAPWLGSYSVDRPIRPLKTTLGGVLLCISVHQAFVGPASLLFSCRCWHVGREGLWRWLQILPVTQQHRLASPAARLSSTGISHRSPLPHVLSIHPSTANSSPHPGIAPQSLNSSSRLLLLPGGQRSFPEFVWLRQGLSDAHSI